MNTFINSEFNIDELNKLIPIIDILTTKNNGFDKIYNNTTIYQQYLNFLSIDDIVNKLLNEKIVYTRVFEIINYLYTQNNLTYDQNLTLIKLINEKYKQDELIILKNKIVCKLITNNTNCGNEVYDELAKYKDSIDGLIQFIVKKKLIDSKILIT